MSPTPNRTFASYLCPPLRALLLVAAVSLCSSVNADAIANASRLLRITDMQSRFEAASAQQTRAIIHSYASIVATSADLILPQRIKTQISSCYTKAYAWNQFERGIAQILTEVFSTVELSLLLDFYSSRSVPPSEFQSFRAAMRKSEEIQSLSADYIYANASGCVEQDAELILAFVNSNSSAATNPAD